jgi:hypothetical protein
MNNDRGIQGFFESRGGLHSTGADLLPIQSQEEENPSTWVLDFLGQQKFWQKAQI